MKKKKTVKRIIGWIVLALVAAGLAILPNLARRAANPDQASVLTAKAEQGEIEYTLAGGGTLTAEDPIEVKIPDTVEVLHYLVENGQRVEKDQALAEVDRVTLLGAMSEVQDSLDALSEQMREEGGSAAATTLYTQSAGRVKAVYAQPNDDVRRVMLEHGALAVLSLDGMMVTEIRTALPVPAGTGLRLELSDGKSVTGVVRTVMDGKLTVVLSDDGPVLGDPVTAYLDDGTEVGTGTLRAHSAWDVIAVDGTVSQVYVRENQTVYAGSGLFRLNGLSGSAEYQSLAAKRGKYEALMADLFSLYNDGIVRAPEAGFVTGIDENKIKNTAAVGDAPRIRLLADEEAVNTPGSWYGMILTDGGDGSFSALVIPSDGNLTQVLDLLSGNGTTMTFYGCQTGVPAAGTLVLIQSDETTVTVEQVDLSGIISGGGGGGFDPGSLPSIDNLPSGLFPSGGLPFTIPSFSFPMGQMSQGEEDDGLYELEEKTILSITPDDCMTVSIGVDELDILRYETGMQADVTVDALPDRSFTAEVKEISPLGENSGGNSKFQVRLQLDRAPDMLDGMNASVVVHGGSKSALILPAAAIYDRGSTSYVYTALDGKTGKPALELAVTTGLSDGENVEILSGLTENQPVFYEYYTGSGS